MAALSPQPGLLFRESGQKEPAVHPFQGRWRCSSMAVCSTAGGGDGGGGIFRWASDDRRGWRRKKRQRGEVKARGFWPEVSRPTSMEMEAITNMEEFEEALRLSQELSQAILVEWMAAWCRKCIYLKPKLEKLAAEFHPRVKFYFIDVNQVPQALVKRGNISKMPTIQLWKDGEFKDEVIGGHKAWLVMDEVREMIRKYI